MSSIQIRLGRPADIPALMEIERHSATAAHWQASDYRAAFARGNPSERLILVIEEAGQAQGFLVAHPLGPEWEIENVAVAGPARRRGLGTRLVGEFLDLARAHGAQTVWLEVRESNQAARSLYQKWAFVESGRRHAYYQNPPEDAILYNFSFAGQSSKPLAPERAG